MKGLSPDASRRGSPSRQVVWLLAGLLVARTVVAVFASFPNYFPADFTADFLLGREAYFNGVYGVAFYTHVISGPFVLVGAWLSLSDPLRRRFPAGHRHIGRTVVVGVLLFAAPSGLVMAARAPTAVASAGFATLALANAWCAAQGWRSAVARRFDMHRVWMTRCFALLFSAVTLRILGGLADLAGVDGLYSYAAWISWLTPLLVVEGWRTNQPRSRSSRS